ncbi:hypothetical protein [Clostridium celatum]|uniref:hypothetical protein n=1 Tax=Clostridium celatum TaxID=36834 RepID=UPI00189B2DC9|nr:hypothetical protein [Clostridium celatum]
MEVLELLKYVNSRLLEGQSVISIAKELGINESSIRKRLNKAGFKRVGNQFVPNNDITSNITNVEVIKNEPIQNEIVKEHELEQTDLENLKNIDLQKLNLLLNNLDKLINLIPNKDITNNITLRDGDNRTISIRADNGLYNAIKERAKRDNIGISEIINRALEDYLRNYI